MHLVETITENVQQAATSQSPFGPEFNNNEVEGASKMEVWGTGFSDEGDDYCEFRLFDEEGKLLQTRRVAGY